MIQGFPLSGQEGLQVAGIEDVVVVVAVHGELPAQQSHEHLNDHLSELCAQNDLHSPTWGVHVLAGVVVIGVGTGVRANVGGGVGAGVTGAGVTGAGVGEVPGRH